MNYISKSKNRMTLIFISVFAFLVLFTGCSTISTYNSLGSLQTDVEEAKSKVDIALQRRYDLIPNVVNATKGYMSHEKEIFTQIADARSKIGSNSKEKVKEGQTELDSAISRLLIVTENYPELKADKQVQSLITELEGTENRILVSRTDYNSIASKYNKSLKRFPTSILAKFMNFEKAEFYEADSKAQTAPTVNLTE